MDWLLVRKRGLEGFYSPNMWIYWTISFPIFWHAPNQLYLSQQSRVAKIHQQLGVWRQIRARYHIWILTIAGAIVRIFVKFLQGSKYSSVHCDPFEYFIGRFPDLASFVIKARLLWNILLLWCRRRGLHRWRILTNSQLASLFHLEVAEENAAILIIKHASVQSVGTFDLGWDITGTVMGFSCGGCRASNFSFGRFSTWIGW